VNENFATIISFNESETFGFIEEFYCTCCHDCILFL
jgi:hypothetical protein